jgi:phosphoglycolate phosphatase
METDTLMADAADAAGRMADAALPAAAGRIRLVIFDFDGTLSDSGDWFLSVVDDLAKTFRFRTVRPQDLDMLRHRSSREVIEYLGIARWKLPFIAWYVRRLVGRNVGQIELFPGTPNLLEKLRDMGVRLALVTSNSEDNARRILGPKNAALIEYFAGGSSLFGKAPKFRKMPRRCSPRSSPTRCSASRRTSSIMSRRTGKAEA